MNDTNVHAPLISPSRGPFSFHSWMELPLPIQVGFDETFRLDYRPGTPCSLRIVIESPVYKIVTGSPWKLRREMDAYVQSQQGGEPAPAPRGWEHEYVPVDGVVALVEDLEARDGVNYVHVEELPSVAYLSCQIPNDAVPKDPFNPFDLRPVSGFFQKEVLPVLHSIVEAYRIATLPWIRFFIFPVSEALIDTAIMRFTDRENTILQNIHYGFDPRGSAFRIAVIDTGIRMRFNDIYVDLASCEPERQISNSYFLFRMRRWAEAVAIASSVVDNLQHKLILKVASSDIEAEALRKAFGYKEIFNKVFPSFGRPKLSEEDPHIWQEFVTAKEYRGKRLHGAYPEPFDPDASLQVKKHLNAFFGIARWLKIQLGLSWSLDFHHADDYLEPFP